MDRCSRWGEQERDRMEIILGSHYFLLIMKHPPPPLDLPASAVLSIRKTEKLSDGVKSVSGTEVVSHVSDKQWMLQSLISHWKLILALRSSILFSKDWTLVSRILGRGGLWALFLSFLCCESQPVSGWCSGGLPRGVIQVGYSSGHCSPPRSEESLVATMDSRIKCPETG